MGWWVMNAPTNTLYEANKHNIQSSSIYTQQENTNNQLEFHQETYGYG